MYCSDLVSELSSCFPSLSGYSAVPQDEPQGEPAFAEWLTEVSERYDKAKSQVPPETGPTMHINNAATDYLYTTALAAATSVVISDNQRIERLDWLNAKALTDYANPIDCFEPRSGVTDSQRTLLQGLVGTRLEEIQGQGGPDFTLQSWAEAHLASCAAFNRGGSTVTARASGLGPVMTTGQTA